MEAPAKVHQRVGAIDLRLDLLPTPIKAVLGGMKKPGIAAFRAHHVGVAINDTDPDADEPKFVAMLTDILGRTPPAA